MQRTLILIETGIYGNRCRIKFYVCEKPNRKMKIQLYHTCIYSIALYKTFDRDFLDNNFFL